VPGPANDLGEVMSGPSCRTGYRLVSERLLGRGIFENLVWGRSCHFLVGARSGQLYRNAPPRYRLIYGCVVLAWWGCRAIFLGWPDDIVEHGPDVVRERGGSRGRTGTARYRLPGYRGGLGIYAVGRTRRRWTTAHGRWDTGVIPTPMLLPQTGCLGPWVQGGKPRQFFLLSTGRVGFLGRGSPVVQRHMG
jgi:hypothetical protein